jgi:hypothetical protein
MDNEQDVCSKSPSKQGCIGVDYIEPVPLFGSIKFAG